MTFQYFYKICIFFLSLAAIAGLSSNAAASNETMETANTKLVEQAFAAWQEGRGSVFDLLAENAVWSVTGSSPVSATYSTRQALMDGAVHPIHARLSTPIKPEIKQIIAQDNHLVVFWNGSAQAKDGSRYLNNYAWHMVFDDGKVTKVNAFLDTWALTKLME